MKGKPFLPTEIIFSVTEACNLKCPHCFVSKSPVSLNIENAKTFLLSCINSNSSIEKIGFSGGEPFLNLEFLCQLSNFVVKQDLLFDQITTNGDWWKNSEDLEEKLRKLFESGYDGNFCLSWDAFHNQNTERMIQFIQTTGKIFTSSSINIQFVKPNENLYTETLRNKETEILSVLEKFPELQVFFLSQSFQSEDKNGWKSKKWFKDDYCQGPGNILFIHPNGNVAPCCGFANETSALCIGTIADSYDTIMENAKNNKMITLCYENGLSSFRKKHRFNRKIFPGITNDICTFCDYVCKNQ